MILAAISCAEMGPMFSEMGVRSNITAPSNISKVPHSKTFHWCHLTTDCISEPAHKILHRHQSSVEHGTCTSPADKIPDRQVSDCQDDGLKRAPVHISW
jgi:hypothetical protein